MGLKRRSKGDLFRPKILKLMPTEDKLTAAAGLATIIEVFDESPLSQDFKEALPKRSMANRRSKGNYRLGLIQLNSFIYGHDCVEDLEEFRDDPLLEAVLEGKAVAPRTMRDFLYDATPETSKKMNEYLSSSSRAIRRQLREIQPEEFKPSAPLTIDMDSTDHEQYGEQIEGAGWNYKGIWGLYSEVAYDELGFCHGIQIGPGNTKPGSTCVPLIEHCFSGLKFTDEKYFRADSAYCWEDPLRTLIRLGATYTITAHDGIMEWRSKIGLITEWTPWSYSEEDIKKATKKNKSLPQVELGRFYWEPSWAKNIKIPVIVKRTWVESRKENDKLPGWEYYAVITNFNLLHNSYQSVMQWHQKRGGVENFIKEEKYGYDLKNFPCQSLQANQLYGSVEKV
jgi:hypothetical protein